MEVKLDRSHGVGKVPNYKSACISGTRRKAREVGHFCRPIVDERTNNDGALTKINFIESLVGPWRNDREPMLSGNRLDGVAICRKFMRVDSNT